MLCIIDENHRKRLEESAFSSQTFAVVQSVGAEVESSWLAMLQQLLSALRTDLPLPKCLQLVGYLRRMELFSEEELRLKFLQCRDSWLQCLHAAVPKDDGETVLHIFSNTSIIIGKYHTSLVVFFF